VSLEGGRECHGTNGNLSFEGMGKRMETSINQPDLQEEGVLTFNKVSRLASTRGTTEEKLRRLTRKKTANSKIQGSFGGPNGARSQYGKKLRRAVVK